MPIKSKKTQWGKNKEVLQCPIYANTDLPTAATANKGAIAYDSTNTKLYFSDGSSWAAIDTSGASATADGIYNNGAWTVTVDANDVKFNLPADYTLKLDNTSTGTIASALEIEASGAGSVITDAILISATTGTITDAISAAAANIVNAINIGGNAIAGTNFNVSAAGAVVGVGVNYGSGALVGTGNITINTNKFTVTAATGDTLVAGTLDVTGAAAFASTLSVGTTTITGDLTVSGSFTFGGVLTVNETFTCDELILDTDGVAPAGTNCYAVRDNGGDLTLNAVTGKMIALAIAGTDEVTLSGTVLDLNANAIDNAGYLVLNAATAPAGTEVYAVNDNTGDLTLNALTGKSVNLAIAGTDEYTFSGTQLNLSTNTLTGTGLWTPAGGIAAADQKLDFTTGYIEFGTTPAAAGDIRQENNVYAISARNAAGAADVDIVKVNASDLIEFGANLAATTLGATLTLGAQQLSLSTGNVTFSGAGYIAMGANPASAGYIRLANNVDIAARNAANAADVNIIKLDASDDVAIGADLQLGANVIYGSATAHTANTADGSLYLHSTLHATKGMVCVPNGTVGLMIGSDGSVDHATTPGTNIISIFNGTAPVGTLVNGGSIYSAGGELTAIDATGNTTVISPHTADGDFIIHSYSASKNKTLRVHLEKLINKLVESNADLKGFVEVLDGKIEAKG